MIPVSALPISATITTSPGIDVGIDVFARMTAARMPPSTSPMIAGGLLYVYDPTDGGLRVYAPASGTLIATLPAASGRWNSPIATDGIVALPEGDANVHTASGVLDIWRLP